MDELKRLDLLIGRCLLTRGPSSASPSNPFQGLVLSEEEIAELLGEEVFAREGNPEYQMLTAQIRELDSHLGARVAASLEDQVFLSLPHLSSLFHLTPFERQCLVVCLAPEIDRKYEKLYAYLQDDVTRRKPSVDLVLNLLCADAQERLAARSAFAPQAILSKCNLLHVLDGPTDDPSPLLSRFLKLDNRIVDFLLGIQLMDARLESFARLVVPAAKVEQRETAEDIKARVRNFARAHFSAESGRDENLTFYFHGPYGSGKRALAEAVCHDLEWPLVTADLERMLDAALPFEELVGALCREAMLQPAALCLENFDCLLADRDGQASRLKSLLEALRTFARVTFVLSSQPWRPQTPLHKQILITHEFQIPGDKIRRQLWEQSLDGSGALADKLDVATLASKFRFTPGQIKEAISAAQVLARWRSPDSPVLMTDLYQACRAQANTRLGALAIKVEPRATWADIVLPPDQLAQLKEICSQSRCRHIVYGDWGFDRKLSLGKGLNVLFSGPPGTGKTMAAEIIAGELGLELYKIDLSQVVSKYIGETEKNLHRIFQEARTSFAILFFDEADALFGKRSEVKDAHDRYANIEIGYLLQKMEEYDGIAILATNLRQNMDEAFVRRLQAIIEFPFPNEENRRLIWKVTFPSEAPLNEGINFELLAREFRLSGGNIKNIALAAAFYAAQDGGVIQMPHLVQATRREYQKLGRAWSNFPSSKQQASIS